MAIAWTVFVAEDCEEPAARRRRSVEVDERELIVAVFDGRGFGRALFAWELMRNHLSRRRTIRQVVHTCTLAIWISHPRFWKKMPLVAGCQQPSRAAHLVARWRRSVPELRKLSDKHDKIRICPRTIAARHLVGTGLAACQACPNGAATKRKVRQT